MFSYSSFSLTALAATYILASCTNSSIQDKKITDQLITALDEANFTINQATAIQMKSLEEKSMDFYTKERSEFWFKIAENVAASTDRVFKIINKADQQQSNEKLITDIYKNILIYKSEILQTNEDLAKTFESNFSFIRSIVSTLEIDSSNKEIPGPFVTSKKNIPFILTILKNKIKILENKIVTFCNIKSSSSSFWFEVYNPLISQNSNILSPGSSLEIRAGVGYFSTKTSPEITINNKTIPLLDSGYALYKIKVPEKEGFYQFPVYTKFLNLNTGKIEIIKKDIKYTVQKKCD